MVEGVAPRPSSAPSPAAGGHKEVARRARRGAAPLGRRRRGRPVHAEGARRLRAVRQALPPARLRGAPRLADPRRPRRLRRHARGPPPGVDPDAREAGAPRDGEPPGTAAEASGPAGGRDREDQHRPPDQQQGQEADGAGPEGVLPQREDQGDPPGARPEGRQVRRARGAPAEDRERRDAEGRQGEGARRAEAARGDAERLGRGDGLAELHRLARERALEEGVARVEGHQERREDPERGPLRPREGQGADPRVPRGPPARDGDEGVDPLLRRPPGRRQDVARQVDRPVAEPQVRAAQPRRRARRGRDPRPPPDLHRRLPRPDHPADEEGGDRQPGLPPRRGRQDVDGLPRRPVRRRSSRSSTPSRTTPSSTTTSTSSTTSRRSCSSPRRTWSTRSRPP